MHELIQLFKLFYKDSVWWDFVIDDEESFVDRVKEKLVNRAKDFFQRLIDNWHMEEIKSEKKSWPDVNDYIKYIATTDDPVKTLSNLIK